MELEEEEKVMLVVGGGGVVNWRTAELPWLLQEAVDTREEDTQLEEFCTTGRCNTLWYT